MYIWVEGVASVTNASLFNVRYPILIFDLGLTGGCGSLSRRFDFALLLLVSGD